MQSLSVQAASSGDSKLKAYTSLLRSFLLQKLQMILDSQTTIPETIEEQVGRKRSVSSFAGHFSDTEMHCRHVLVSVSTTFALTSCFCREDRRKA